MSDQTSALIEHFSEQATWCDYLGSPFSARLLRQLGEDFTAGGVVKDLVGGWRGSPRSDVVGLRLLGALHAAAMSNTAPDLTAVYPPQTQDAPITTVWPVVKTFLDTNREWVSDFLKQAPQTNETRRAIMLTAGFLSLAQRFNMPMNLLELGASAGLNTIWDRYHYQTDSWSWGDPNSVTIGTKWEGPPPPVYANPNILARAACDIHPLDVSDDTSVRRLRSYIWADQAQRLERFDGAVKLARDAGYKVDQADAAEWLAQKLASRPQGALTVVYHSVFFQYPPKETRQRLRDLIRQEGENASSDAPLAWLRFEPEAMFSANKKSLVTALETETWPDGARNLLARADSHVRSVEAVGF